MPFQHHTSSSLPPGQEESAEEDGYIGLLECGMSQTPSAHRTQHVRRQGTGAGAAGQAEIRRRESPRGFRFCPLIFIVFFRVILVFSVLYFLNKKIIFFIKFFL